VRSLAGPPGGVIATGKSHSASPTPRSRGAIRTSRSTPKLQYFITPPRQTPLFEHEDEHSLSAVATAHDARRSRSASQARRAPQQGSGEGGSTRTILMRLEAPAIPSDAPPNSQILAPTELELNRYRSLYVEGQFGDHRVITVDWIRRSPELLVGQVQ
jgi:hypothetical protein